MTTLLYCLHQTRAETDVSNFDYRVAYDNNLFDTTLNVEVFLFSPSFWLLVAVCTYCFCFTVYMHINMIINLTRGAIKTASTLPRKTSNLEKVYRDAAKYVVRCLDNNTRTVRVQAQDTYQNGRFKWLGDKYNCFESDGYLYSGYKLEAVEACDRSKWVLNTDELFLSVSQAMTLRQFHED